MQQEAAPNRANQLVDEVKRPFVVSNSDLDSQSQTNTFRHTSKNSEGKLSFIKDGYEVHVEAVYMVNGRKKRKVKKKKLAMPDLSLNESDQLLKIE